MRNPSVCLAVFSILFHVINCKGSKYESEDVDEYDDLDLDDEMRDVERCFKLHRMRRFFPSFICQPSFVHKENDPIVSIDAEVIDEADINDIKVLKDCIHEFSDDHLIINHNSDDKKYRGSSNTTLLGGYVQKILPRLIIKMRKLFSTATEYAGWRPHPFHLGFKSIRHIIYGLGRVGDKERNSNYLFHEDPFSIYTAIVMLSHPDNYTGGDFLIRKDVPLTINGERYFQHNNHSLVRVRSHYKHAILYDSEKSHGLHPISEGKREVLVFELWPYEDPDYYDTDPMVEEYTDFQLNTPLLMIKEPLLPSSIQVLNIMYVAAIFSQSYQRYSLELCLSVVIGMLLGLCLALLLLLLLSTRSRKWKKKVA